MIITKITQAKAKPEIRMQIFLRDFFCLKQKQKKPQ